MAWSRPQVAFLTAALALLALPVLTMVVLQALGIAVAEGVDRQTFETLLPAAVAVILLVFVIILAIAWRLHRKSTIGRGAP